MTSSSIWTKSLYDIENNEIITQLLNIRSIPPTDLNDELYNTKYKHLILKYKNYSIYKNEYGNAPFIILPEDLPQYLERGFHIKPILRNGKFMYVGSDHNTNLIFDSTSNKYYNLITGQFGQYVVKRKRWHKKYIPNLKIKKIISEIKDKNAYLGSGNYIVYTNTKDSFLISSDYIIYPEYAIIII